jgi:folate-dependent phosphoribosylglycinamide formyltransferase PurN
MVKRWVALFSQTGSEIYNLSQTFGRVPDIVISNTYEVSDKIVDPRLMGATEIICREHRNVVDSLLKLPNSLITLHGYLKILPSDVCNAHEIYNGHPGLITQYPELKGKDPQEKVWKNLQSYTRIGSVVHRCIPEVDSGRVEEVYSVPNSCVTKDDVYTALRDTSLRCWVNFLERRIL